MIFINIEFAVFVQSLSVTMTHFAFHFKRASIEVHVVTLLSSKTNDVQNRFCEVKTGV